MGLIRTRILAGVQSLIGGAPGGNSVTVLEDDSVTQVLPIVPDIARRALSPGETGWWVANFDNIHPGADSIKSEINPYDAGASVPAGSQYPTSIPSDQDLWLMGASLVRFAGAGDLNTGTLQLDPAPRQQAWGIDNSGAAVVVSGEFLLAGWIGLDTNSVIDWGKGGDGSLGVKRLAIRLPRSSLLLFRSNSSAAASFRVAMVFGLFPAGLGEDILG